MRRLDIPIAMIACGLLLLSTTTHARELSFEERVQAQAAIERVYYSHQVGASRTFEQAVPRALLERKVRTYLEQTAALQAIWRTPVSGAMLRRELERMAAGTRMPERLRELHAALGDDPFLIQECLARPSLVDRLSRNFLARDATIQAGPRSVAESLRRDLLGGRIDPRADHAARAVTDLVLIDRGTQPRPEDLDGAPPDDGGVPRLEVGPEEFARVRSRLPSRTADIGALVEDAQAFVIHVVLDTTAESVRFATFTVPKVGWDSWRARVERRLNRRSIDMAAADITSDPIPLPAREASLSGTACAPDDTWDNGSFDDWPEARTNHTAVWTGSLMIVWGGAAPGGRYDPATDTWNATSAANAPSARTLHAAVWTGSEMIVWGGWNGSTSFDSGGRYDPSTDTWIATSRLSAPSPRRNHSAVWTGSTMIVWGGSSPSASSLDSGGRYDPATDSWTPTSPIDAPSARSGGPAVWTGTRMIVWGGSDGSVFLDTGGSYDPAADTWSPTSPIGAPSPRADSRAVWTDTEMIVWGGRDGSGHLATGGRYDPASDEWVATSMTEAPAARSQHRAVWTGSEMIVWGGNGGPGQTLADGARFDPATDAWTPTSTTNGPSARVDHSAIWTGSAMIVWGGVNGNNTLLSSGGRYDPALDSWTPTADTAAPSARYQHAAVWTGNHLIVWGGDSTQNTGGRYDPVTDTWSPTSVTNAPVARQFLTAVWTGDVMIAWGGLAGLIGHALNTGGRYDPVADSWSPTSLVDAPSVRVRHTAVWSGSRMIVWGGSNAGVRTGTGGLYDPVTDVWTPTSMTDAPSPRATHSAVWTGSEMIVWGGQQFAGTWFDSGGRYNPATDAWAPTSISGAPAGRLMHTAVMTGSLMIVWGGSNGSGPLDTGGRYDISTDSWTATATIGAPVPRTDYSAAWTGSAMIIWGGRDVSGAYLDTGGRYDPVADAWAATSITGAPAGRIWHTATWTGSHMAVWGGWVGGYPGRTGGLYSIGHAVDDDGDGASECAGDCNDGNAAVHPGALEICDGIDNDCNGLSDDVLAPVGIASLSVGQSGDAGILAWPPVAASTRYDVVRGDLSILLSTQGDFSSSTQACLANDLVETSWPSGEAPASGGAYWYLVRPVNCGGNGTYDSGDPAQAGPRDAGINASASSCP